MNPFSIPAKHPKPWATSLLALLIPMSLVLTACGPDEVFTEHPPRPVRVVDAKPLDSIVQRTFSGRLRATAGARLSFRVGGKVAERRVDIGSKVLAGQEIARLEDDDFRLRRDRAQAQLDTAGAEVRRARAALDRIQALYASDNATRDQLDNALAALDSAEGVRLASQRALDLAVRELSYTRLGAGRSGVVADLRLEAGENVAPGQWVVEIAESAGSLEVEWSVPEGLIGGFQVGMGVDVGLASVGGTAQATVIEVGAAPRGAVAGYPVVARLEGEDPRRRPGMAAEVTADLGRHGSADTDIPSGAVLLPSHAVAGDPNGHYVLVLGDGEGDSRTVMRRTVTIGHIRPEGLEILDGVRAGETVVAAGVGFLDDGQTVRLLRGDPLAEWPSTAPASSSGGAR